MLCFWEFTQSGRLQYFGIKALAPWGEGWVRGRGLRKKRRRLAAAHPAGEAAGRASAADFARRRRHSARLAVANITPSIRTGPRYGPYAVHVKTAGWPRMIVASTQWTENTASEWRPRSSSGPKARVEVMAAQPGAGQKDDNHEVEQPQRREIRLVGDFLPFLHRQAQREPAVAQAKKGRDKKNEQHHQSAGQWPRRQTAVCLGMARHKTGDEQELPRCKIEGAGIHHPGNHRMRRTNIHVASQMAADTARTRR